MLEGLCRMVLVHTLVLAVIQVCSQWSIRAITPSNSIATAYGGFGFTSRKWGLTLDTIKSINLVKADGTIITASNSQNSDIFWVRFNLFLLLHISDLHQH
jgi:hypothetical protein